MTKKSNKSEKTRDKLGQTLMMDLINHLHTQGLLTDEDLNDKEVVRTKTQKYLKKHQGNFDFKIITDHREEILKMADQLNKKGDNKLAIALYATFIEHTLNKIISIECSNKNIDSKTQTEIIKGVNIIGKCTWLFKLLGLQQIKQNYVKTILQISEERNSYIHYKWKPEPDIETEKTKKNADEKIENIKALIKYLKNYDTKHHYKGQKTKIINATNRND